MAKRAKLESFSRLLFFLVIYSEVRLVGEKYYFKEIDMKFGYTILYVDDVPATVAFYEKAFELKRLFVHESNTYGEMDTGTTKLAFVKKGFVKESGLDFGQLGNNAQSSNFEVALVTPDVESAFQAAVKNGAAALKKPVQKPWGQIVGYVRDCNGFLIEICSPMGE